MIVQFRNEKVSNHGSIPITIDCNVVALIVFEEGFHQPIKRTKQSVFLDVTVFRHTLSFTPNAAVLFVDVAIQPKVRFIAKQNSLMKIGNNGNLVLGPFDESKSVVQALLKKGISYREIAKIVGRSHSCVQKIIERFKSDGLIENKSGRGRKSILSDVAKRKVLKDIKIDPKLSVVKLAAETSRIMGRSVSAETVRNVIRHAGYSSRVARKKPFISLNKSEKAFGVYKNSSIEDR
ncbi:HTH_Tnp_Tc3_2 domain-containing protein [Trichonephila clavipes]|nr:HTH_Tnp_Tc3_2 domain-containing protein [Trichonephila clavipes]